MRKFLDRLTAFRFSAATFPLFLLGLCLLAYAPLITRLGFYWDDFPINWIATTMGGEGLARYFSTNRPVWGLVYRLTTLLLGSRPITWQIFAILLRWLCGLALWFLLRLLWPERDEQFSGRRSFAAWAAALFVIYPGFSQQYIAFLYSHFYIIQAAFLLSLGLMVLAHRKKQGGRWFWPLTGTALLLSLLNLLSMEYFFLLDLLRPVLLWLVIASTIPDHRERLKRVSLAWLPYLLIFAGAMFWRSVLFGFHTYQPALAGQFKSQPVETLLHLIPLMLGDVWKTSVVAWAQAFIPPTALDIGVRHFQRYWLFLAAGIVISALYLVFYKSEGRGDGPRSSTFQEDPGGHKASILRKIQGRLFSERWALQPILIGLLALFIAGGPFWLADLKVGLVFSNDRFTIPFMLGASLAWAGLLAFAPLPRWSKAGLLAVALGFAIGLQYQNAVSYSTDWSQQRSLFWQMVWRMPDLQPNTALLSNELPLTHYSDNSLTAPLNWIYDPQNDPAVMKYALLYPTVRAETKLSTYEAGQPIDIDYLATTFQGSTSQMVAIFYNPPGCLRVLDPQVDVYNWMVPLYLRDHLNQVNFTPILSEPQHGKPAPRPPASIYGSEIAHGWCYYFEKADLARQLGEWQKVAALGDEAFSSSDYPNDPLERFPFIEGYAHVGRWDRAISLTHDTFSYSPQIMQPMVCKLWDRIEQAAPASPEKQSALQTVQAELRCSQAFK
jgi:hypothetical protein